MFFFLDKHTPLTVPLSKTADGVAGPRDLQIVDDFVDQGIERDLIDMVMTDPRCEYIIFILSYS